MVALSADTKRKRAIIATIATKNNPSLADISRATNIPMASLQRLIAHIRLEYDMDIRFVKDNSGKGRSGYYLIYDWGWINDVEFLIRYSTSQQQ